MEKSLREKWYRHSLTFIQDFQMVSEILHIQKVPKKEWPIYNLWNNNPEAFHREYQLNVVEDHFKRMMDFFPTSTLNTSLLLWFPWTREIPLFKMIFGKWRRFLVIRVHIIKVFCDCVGTGIHQKMFFLSF